MKKKDLQMFAEKKAVSGKKIVYLFRAIGDAAKTVGTTLAFTTENGRTKSKDSDSTVTKDGNIRTPGESEVEITATCYLTVGDKILDRLEQAMDNDEIIEIWETNLEEKAESEENKYKGTYFQGYLTEFEKTSSAEEYVEISLTFGINGKGVKGDVTVTTEQQALAEYVFRDTVKAMA